MRTHESLYVLSLCACVTVTLLVSGCGKSNTSDPAAQQNPAPSQSAQTPVAEPAKVVSAPVQAEAKPAAAAVSDLTKSLADSAQAQAQTLVADLTRDLYAKAQSLTQSLGSESSTTEALNSAVKSLAENQDLQSLGFVQQLTQAKLTPEQTQVASEVRDLVSAIAVQKNF
jgi:hypothetical protein